MEWFSQRGNNSSITKAMAASEATKRVQTKKSPPPMAAAGLLGPYLVQNFNLPLKFFMRFIFSTNQGGFLLKLEQGSDLIHLRLTWREIENLIFVTFLRNCLRFLEKWNGIFWKFWTWKISIVLSFVRKTSSFQVINLKNEVLRPSWPPNGLGGQI